MAFYIKPPKGIISRRKLQKYAAKRFHFLADLINCNGNSDKLAELLEQISTVDGSECLITGSQCDRISHFILRLALCNSPTKAEWFINAEVNLFKIRLDAQSDSEKEQCLKEAQHQIIKLSSFQPYSYRHILLTLKSICKLMKAKKTSNTIKVPFEHALTFVRKRELPLQNGNVIVPMQKVKDLLLSLHELILCEGTQLLKNSNCAIDAASDSRIKNIANQLQCHFGYQVPSFELPRTLLAKDMDHASKQFPPCMRHLYKILKHRHRLQHKARIQLTLFLKDIGMPLEEALKFWENEYSKPVTCSTACSHSWGKEKQRYIYNIRHLYGQEGSRKNYRSQSCYVLQDGLIGSCHEGGCPFAQFDIENIGKVIFADNIKEQQASEIINIIQQKKYKEACLQYLKAQILNQNNINLSTSYQSVPSEEQNCNYVQNGLKRIKMDHTHITNSAVIPFTNVHNNSRKTCINLQRATTKPECYSSEKLNSCHVQEKVINSSFTIHKPIDYFNSYQLLLEGIRD